MALFAALFRSLAVKKIGSLGGFLALGFILGNLWSWRPSAAEDRQPMPRPTEAEQAASEGPAIQWFATWESGLAEARRTERPILLVAAAPHCGGVPGIW
jgi:hypothetical protein